MKKNLIYFWMLISISLFIGCTKVPNVDFNVKMHKDIKRIAIVPPYQKKEIDIYRVEDSSLASEFSLGIFMGIFPPAQWAHTGKMLNDMTTRKSKISIYNKLIASTKFNYNAYFVSRLTYYLKREQYSVQFLSEVSKKTYGFMREYPDVNVDAYLDLRLYVSYMAENMKATYKPTVCVSTRLVKKKNNAILFDKVLTNGAKGPLDEEMEYLGYNKNECYKDFDALKANAIQSVDRLKKALDQIAKHLAVSLRRR